MKADGNGGGSYGAGGNGGCGNSGICIVIPILKKNEDGNLNKNTIEKNNESKEERCITKRSLIF